MAVPPPLTIDKQRLRARLRAVRAAEVARLTQAGDLAATEAVAVRALARIPAGATVALYRAVGGEIDPMPLAARLAAAGYRLALPHVTDRATPMRFLAWHPEAPLFAGAFGLHQPHDSSAPLVPDLIVTPLIGFDRAGGRLGQGAGHYDRAFADTPEACRIGYAWACQEVDAIPRDPWDMPLDAVATEREWIAMPGGRA